MSNEKDQQERAEQLRKQIEQLNKSAQEPGPEGMKPGESPREYVERRAREIARKQPPAK